MNTNHLFLIKWVSITSLGWLLAQTIGVLITIAAFPKAELAALSTSPLYFGIFGCLFGLAQWICIRERLPNSFSWVIVTTMGCYVAALTLKLLNRSEMINSFLKDFPLLAYFFGGMLLGYAQHLVIRKTLPASYWWIIIVATSWLVTNGLIGIDNAAFDFLGVLLFATLTGFTFVWLGQNTFSEVQPT